MDCFQQCTTEYVEKNHRCSMCNQPVTTDNQTYQECIYTLKRMFPDVEAPQCTPNTTAEEPSENQTIIVSVMGGELIVIEFDQNMKVIQLKKRIEEFFKVKPDQQRLLYQDKELKVEVCYLLNLLSVPQERGTQHIKDLF